MAKLPKPEFKARLEALSLTQATLARALGLSRSAPTNWTDGPPDYVVAYLIALEHMDTATRLDVIHKACVDRLRREEQGA